MGAVEGPPTSSGFWSGAEVRTPAEGGPANDTNGNSAIRVIRVIRWQLLLPPLAPPRKPAGCERSFDSAHGCLHGTTDLSQSLESPLRSG